MSDLLQVTDLVKIYGRRDAATRALDGVSLSLAAGEYVGIMGASGSGKTTLLNCISTIDRPTSGSIQVDGQELTKLRGKELTRFRRERLGFIFQDCNLLDTLTAFENIALSLSIVGTPAGEIKGRVEEMASLLGISECLQKYPYQMSGGQQQRCAAARAMVTHDAFTASWCHRILFIKDGRLWHELRRDGEDRRRFFQDIIGVVSRLGGDAADVL